MIEISVIMLVYNRENFVARAIESILSQSYREFEFIIVNNGSTDSSAEICEYYSRQDSRIKLIHKEKGNIGSGRNSGLEMARGRYITFIDDDDIAEPDMLAFMHHLIVKYDADISLCGSYKHVNGKLSNNCVFDDCLVMDAATSVVELLNRVKYNVAMPTKMLKRELFNDIRFKNSGKYDDISVGYRYFANAKRVVGHGIPKYTFYRHESNNSNFTTNDSLLTPDQLKEYFEAFRERTSYLSEKLPEISSFARYSEWSYMISMCHKIISNNLTNCEEPLAIAKSTLISNYAEFYNSPYLKDFERNWIHQYIELR